LPEPGRTPNGGLVVMTDAFMFAHRADVTALTFRHRLPVISPYRAYTEDGALLSYGYDPLDNYRRASIYADRVLKGIKPSDLPVQAPVQFQLVVNARTARALGLDVPSSFYWRADEVIE
jgi:putative ABC transport system substrate-binding protein